MGRNRRRIYALVGAAAVAGALLAVAPALGDHQGPINQVEFHAFDGGPRIVAPGHVQELVTTKKNECNLADDGSLLHFDGDNRGPGISGLGIGIKSSGSSANGVPCSQVDSNEKLWISPGTLLTGRAFSGVELDLEMTGNAIVLMTFSPTSGDPVTYELHTGTSADALCDTYQEDEQDPESTVKTPWPGCDNKVPGNPTEVDSETGIYKTACNAPQNSGPNSGASDNCIWTVYPEFDAVLIELTTAKNSGGTVSLEGGSETFRPSIFYLANEPLRCDESLTVGPNGDGVKATYERLLTEPCPDKWYALDITTTDNLSTIRFQPSSPGPHPNCSTHPDQCTEEFKGTITFESRAASNPFGMGTLQYDPAFVADLVDAVFVPMEWCVFDPFNIPVAESEEEQLKRRHALPVGHSWCIVSATNVVQADGKIQTTWVVYGIGDPLKRVS